MNFFEKTLKTPSIPTTNQYVQTILDARTNIYLEAEKALEEIQKIMAQGMSQQDAFRTVMTKYMESQS